MIEVFLEGQAASFRRYDSEDELVEAVAELLATENVVGWMHGRMEFGPRALGGRSILGDARSPEMQSVMNLKIKFRESFRPFAPSVLRSRIQDYFVMREGEDSPYMLLVADVLSDAHYLSIGGLMDPTLRRSIDRMQIELVAARVSAMNECFY